MKIHWQKTIKNNIKKKKESFQMIDEQSIEYKNRLH